MKSRELNDRGEKTWLLVFDKDDEVIATLTGFAKTHAIQAAHFTAIGAFSKVVLGYFDRNRKDYTKIPLREQVEVLSLIGDRTSTCSRSGILDRKSTRLNSSHLGISYAV